MGIIFGLRTAFIQGFSIVLLKRSYEDIKPSETFAIETIFGIIIWNAYTLFSRINFAKSLEIFPILVLSVVLSEAYIFYIYSKGQSASLEQYLMPTPFTQ